MKLKIINEQVLEHKTEALVLGMFEGEPLDRILKKVDETLNKELSSLILNGEFKGEKGEKKTFRTYGALPAKKVLVLGLGKKDDFNLETLRRASSGAAKVLRAQGSKSFSSTLHSASIKGAKASDKAQASTEGMLLGLYEFRKYITVDKDKIKSVDSITILESDKAKLKEVTSGAKKGELLAGNVNYVRDLVNESADTVTPAYLANEAKKVASSSKGKVKVKILGLTEIKKLKMGGLLAVSKGSDVEPRFIILEYKGGKGKPIVLVGKGITFDAGGLDIKPWKYMLEMRSDMAGAATVLGTIKAASELGLKKNIVAIMPCCENLLGGKAFKQGDILTAYNGKTIEVHHTDAEGRLVLADGLSYAEKHFKAEAIIDIATLTGASIIALGYEITSLISTDDAVKKRILDAADKVSEHTWELPIIDEYKELIKGEIGDVMNMSKEPTGPGTITAGIFLSHFVDKTPWAHLDIGASGWAPSDKSYKKKGATGVCLRTFIRMLEDWK